MLTFEYLSIGLWSREPIWINDEHQGFDLKEMVVLHFLVASMQSIVWQVGYAMKRSGISNFYTLVFSLSRLISVFVYKQENDVFTEVPGFQPA